MHGVVRRIFIVGMALLLVACSRTESATPLPRGPIVPTREIPYSTPSAADESEVDNASTLLEFGGTVTGRIRGSTTENRYPFAGQAGDVVILRMRAESGDLDAYLILEGPDGEEIARNDDEESAQGYDAGLINVVLPLTGTYTVIATRFNPIVGTTEGDFSLTLERGEVIELTPEAASAIESDSTQLLPGTSVSGTIDDMTQVARYTIEVQGERLVTLMVEVDEDGLDPVLLLLDPDGRELVRGVKAVSGAIGTRITDLRLPETGRYTVVVTRFGGQIGRSSGDYVLSLREGQDEAQTIGLTGQEISYGSRVTREITADDSRHLYTFAGDAGDIISVVSTATDPSELDTFMILTDANGSEIVRNDDNVFALEGNDSFSAAIFFQPLPHDGFYTVEISRFGRGVGEYALELRLEERGDSKTLRVLQGVVDPFASFGQLSNGARITLFAVGDWVAIDGEPELTIASLVTIALPELPQGELVRSALLDLSSCLIRGGDVFTELGHVTIYQNAMFTSSAELTTTIVENAVTIDALEDCEIVDVTDVVNEAFTQEMRFVQFGLRVEGQSILENDRTDAVIFPYPRLEITTE